ncbi:hypothetical protein [Magnetovibrio sp.]|uniref:hypothetical protein n=1 Tax=Magnetovibrio sp. TaxID=2024836 RepID=UPI002F9271EC
MNMLKSRFRTFATALAGIGLITALTFDARDAHADMAQTDVALVQQMAEASTDKQLEALEIYYALHVSELAVQNMNERRTGAMFAVQRAKADNSPKGKISALEQKAQEVVAERTAKVEENQKLRKKLSEISGLDFAEPLVMAPDAPMDMPTAPAGVPADLVAAQKDAWTALLAAQNAWQEERLTLLDAQQRYDETRDVPIGDHLRAMTLAETAYAKAIGACRLIEAKIAAAQGKSLAEVLSAL